MAKRRKLPGMPQSTTVQAMAGLVAAFAAVGSVFVAYLALGSDNDDNDNGNGDAPAPVGAAVEELVKATVRLEVLDDNGDFLSGGSGSVISSDGLVLTAAHIVDGQPARIEIGVSENVHEPTEAKYLAEVEALDDTLDLAVLKITMDINGDRETGLRLPFVETGDSDTLQILEDIRILGFPSTGGQTLTATRGQVSGFEEDSDIGERSLLKTDATIGGGSSGGMAVNSEGRLIGVPIQFGASERASATECRQEIADTNGDGLIDEADSCVPIGGFINSLRPVNFARPLIEAATNGTVYVPIQPTPEPGDGEDPPAPAFENLVFGPEAKEDNTPTEILAWAQAGAVRVCGFWDYSGMSDGMRWDAVWYVNGRRNDDVSFERQVWSLGESGTTWVCMSDEEFGLAEGVYELAVTFDGIIGAVDGIFVGGEHPPATLTVTNNSNTQICEVFVSPSGAEHGWGSNDLPEVSGIDGRASETISLPGGTWDVKLEDCNGDELDTVFGIEIEGEYELEYPQEAATATPAAE
jgi:S1-C subfamily serine protease